MSHDSPKRGDSTKADRLYEHLLATVASLGPDRRLPSIRSLMTRFEISQSTVMNALTRLEAKGEIYRKHGSGIFTAGKISRRPVLAYVDSDAAISPSSFWEIMLLALRARHMNGDPSIEVRFSKAGPAGSRALPLDVQLKDGLGEQITRKEFAGVYAICQSDEFLEFVRDCDVPIVGFACPARYHVILAYLEAAQMGVAELVRLGCRRIAFYSASYTSLREVFVAALQAHGVDEFPVPEDFDVMRSVTDNHGILRTGFEAATRVFGLDGGDRPDGIVSLDDTFSHGYLMGIEASNLRVGRDVQVATMTNAESFTLAGWHDRIARMEFEVGDIATLMHSAMTALIRGTEPAAGWEKAVWLRHRLAFDPTTDFPVRVAMLRPKLISHKL